MSVLAFCVCCLAKIGAYRPVGSAPKRHFGGLSLDQSTRTHGKEIIFNELVDNYILDSFLIYCEIKIMTENSKFRFTLVVRYIKSRPPRPPSYWVLKLTIK